jgi:dUTPase
MAKIVKLKKLDENAIVPEYAYPTDAGMDLKSSEEYVLMPNETAMINTGLSVAIPEKFFGGIYSKSGLASRGIIVANSPGVVDCIPEYEKIKTPNGYVKLKNFLSSEKVDVISFNVEKRTEEIDMITEVWQVGEKEVLEIILESGEKVHCTETQLILTEEGWCYAKDLTEEHNLISPL